MKKPLSSRTKAERRGRWGELLAALYLQAQFFRIVVKRYKTPVGEIDLIAERGSTTIFVEVKTRARRENFASAMETVNQRRIARAAQYYLSRHPHLTGHTLRFDVILLAPLAMPHHVRNAFDIPE